MLYNIVSCRIFFLSPLSDLDLFENHISCIKFLSKTVLYDTLYCGDPETQCYMVYKSFNDCANAILLSKFNNLKVSFVINEYQLTEQQLYHFAVHQNLEISPIITKHCIINNGSLKDISHMINFV